ncbi:hypothetical protein [Streptomyces sp. NPDC101145]|uniref:hypothetical protein n=1 Tax=Streptomyces sp. NPDC101145 TaxID=3366112 RepID=UPI0037F43915
MTAEFGAAPDTQSSEPVCDPAPIRPRSDVAALGRLGKQYDRVADGDTEGVLRLVVPWLPVPDAESLRGVRESLVAAAHLLPLTAHRHPDNPAAYTVLGLTVTTALHDWPVGREIEIWRPACVATTVLEVLGLAGDAA